jgi:hypothetical protein
MISVKGWKRRNQRFLLEDDEVEVKNIVKI